MAHSGPIPRRLLLLSVVLMAMTAAGGFGLAVQPLPHVRHLVPPSPRDGGGTGSTVAPILIFHSIRPYTESDTAAARRYIATPETLEEELAYLRDHGYTSITLDDLVDAITKDHPLPPRPVVLSFDDDWESQYTDALPLLQKYGFTATFYIWVAAVGKRHHMTWDEIRALSAAGMQIGCHSMTHPYLTRVAKDAALRWEIFGAKRIIEDRVGVRVTSFAYPFGQYDERVVEMVKRVGVHKRAEHVARRRSFTGGPLQSQRSASNGSRAFPRGFDEEIPGRCAAESGWNGNSRGSGVDTRLGGPTRGYAGRTPRKPRPVISWAAAGRSPEDRSRRPAFRCRGWEW